MLERAKMEGLSQVDKPQLQDALERYASVTGPFGPHERDNSTRTLIYEPALALRSELVRMSAATGGPPVFQGEHDRKVFAEVGFTEMEIQAHLASEPLVVPRARTSASAPAELRRQPGQAST